MALVYERHFRDNPAGGQGWAGRVRRFDVGRFTEDGQSDEIVLKGEGWSYERAARSNSADDKLTLAFRGTRVDLVMPPTHGRATVLIDGQPPSALNLFHGTRPESRILDACPPNIPMTYHTGRNMQAETWTLTLTSGNTDADPTKANQRLTFRLTGSKTGFDGEGRSDMPFTSTSGRIRLLPTDWMTAMEPVGAKGPAPEMKAFEQPPQIVWQILPDGCDTVPPGPGWIQAPDWYSGIQYDYVTVADGLPCGIHTLTLVPVPDPNPNNAFLITGVDVHLPPLARDAVERTAP